MTPLLLPLPGNEALADALSQCARWPTGRLETRNFPDGETYLRIEGPCAGQSVALICTLDRPDRKLLPLLFAADTLRELGVTRLGLVAPYLAYMRQDRRFHAGEAVTSRIFAALVSSRPVRQCACSTSAPARASLPGSGSMSGITTWLRSG